MAWWVGTVMLHHRIKVLGLSSTQTKLTFFGGFCTFFASPGRALLPQSTLIYIMCNIKLIPLYSNINRLNPCHPSLSNIMRQGGSKTEHTEQRARNCQNKTGSRTHTKART